MQLIYEKEGVQYTLESLIAKYPDVWIDCFNSDYRCFGGNNCIEDVIIEASDAFEECCLLGEGYIWVDTRFDIPTDFNSILIQGIWGYFCDKDVVSSDI